MVVPSLAHNLSPSLCQPYKCLREKKFLNSFIVTNKTHLRDAS